jgi:segregation and condensation protein A
MTEPQAVEDAQSFEEDRQEVAPNGLDFRLDLDGYEGPIDVLLQLARDQKVDLTHISILELAEQYLSFVRAARHLRLELAADYLVMAAWLAYLKSRLLLPEEESGEEPSGAEMAAALRFQLQRLEAMQEAGQRLMARPQLGREFFARGAPEPLKVVSHTTFDATLYDLLQAYALQSAKVEASDLHIPPTELYSVDDAIHRLRRLLGHVPSWRVLSSFLPSELEGTLLWRSALATTFAASLELCREGELKIREAVPESDSLPESIPDTLRLVEALLFASAEPVTRDALARHVPEDTDLDALLDRLQSDYEGRGIALVRVGKRWAFRTAEDLAGRLKIETESQRKLSRAAIETLAIIAYHQPVTRGEIEEIRGVALSKGTLDTLLEASWVGPKGRRRTPGRPVTWGTTDAFLDHFGLENLDALPGLAELKAAGLLDTRPAIAALNASGRLSELAAEEAGASEEAEGEPETEESLEDLSSAPLAADFGEDLVPDDEAQEIAT